MRADIVTVFHNETNRQQHKELFDAICIHEPDGDYRLIGVDNRTTNRGFGAACNLGAFHPDADAPMVGFLNPDVIVRGPFLDAAASVLHDRTVITGNRFDKPASHLAAWGLRDWVCGATFFVNRKWFQSVGGFDARYVWAFEETDLIRQALAHGYNCRSVNLALEHASPTDDSPEDQEYKRRQFTASQLAFNAKWGMR